MIDMSKKIPIGLSEFKEIITQDYYYVDKTLLIQELLSSGTKVTLFTRPRRFGKTLNMTMLRDFFDITQENSLLFDFLNISACEYYSELNNYPTLYFSFRDCKGDKSYIIKLMKQQIFLEYRKYYFIYDHLDSFEKADMDIIIETLRSTSYDNLQHISDSIKFLSKIISDYYSKQVILIIDEYDTPMVESYTNHCYEDLQDFFSLLYSSALKDNPYLSKGILTGIQRIAKENIFSGLNNIKVYTVTDAQYNQYFGLTPGETKNLLRYYNLELTPDVTNMYDGYHFGGQQIYNPWSIMNYADTSVLCPYWINTASNELIRNIIKTDTSGFHIDFEKLISQKEVNVSLETHTSFWELGNEKTLWGLLLNSGYITVKNSNTYLLQTVIIPNQEVKSDFQKIISSYTDIPESSLDKLFYYLIEDYNLDEFKRIYRSIILQNTSFMDAKENAYHMLFLGMSIYLDNYYTIQSNVESGHGRSDITMVSINPSKSPNILIEFKQSSNVKKGAQSALQQIISKQYYSSLSGPTILLGIAHNKKECEILSQELEIKYI